MPKNWIPLALLVSALIAVLIYEYAPAQLERPTNLTDSGADYPIFFIEQLSTTQFDTAGQLNYQFSAERADHFQVDAKKASPADHTELDKPSFIFYKAEAIPWKLEAMYGTSFGEGARIELTGSVRAWQQLSATSVAEITTEQLTLLPQRQFAQTDKPVMILYPRAAFKGDGLEADFRDRTFTLLANVKGRHEPPSR